MKHNQVKVIEGVTAGHVERLINKWLNSNQGIEIIDIKFNPEYGQVLIIYSWEENYEDNSHFE